MKKILLILLTSFFIYSCLDNVFAKEPVYRYTSVIVSSGDTMWDIASRSTQQGEDVREVIQRIYLFNDLKSKYVYPGQVLVIPVAIENASDFQLAAQ